MSMELDATNLATITVTAAVLANLALLIVVWVAGGLDDDDEPSDLD